MSDKLNESQIRGFMKLASLGSLAETFIDKTGLAQEVDLGEEEPLDALGGEEGLEDEEAPVEEPSG